MKINVLDIDNLSFQEQSYRAMTQNPDTAQIINIKRDGDYSYLYLCGLVTEICTSYIMFRANNPKDLDGEIKSFLESESKFDGEQKRYFGEDVFGLIQEAISGAKVEVIARLDMPKNTNLRKEARVLGRWIEKEKAKRKKS